VLDWTDIIKVVGGTGALVAGTVWLIKSIITHLFSKEIEVTKINLKAHHDSLLEKAKIDLKADYDLQLEGVKALEAKELERLRSNQQKALTAFQTNAQQQLAHVQAALERVERLEADLLKSRARGYGKIWKLTGSLNLFGSTSVLDSHELSTELKDWYFEHGWVLTQDSKRRYFLVQEVLNFGMLKSISFRRPADEELFSSRARPVEVLRELRSRLFEVANRGDESDYKVDELETFVTAWKSQALKHDQQEHLAEKSWVLLQFVLSAFRSGVVKELGSREMLDMRMTVDMQANT
jgi:hypothetical protein